MVHDYKREGEKRVSRVRLADGVPVQVDVVPWQGAALPVDLESISAVPGRPGEYTALESPGHGYHLGVAGDTARVLREFTVPGVRAPATTTKASRSRPVPLPLLTVRPEPVELARFEGHRVEALACPSTARTGVLGTDDENLGGAIRTADICLA
ncbi:hypothetical protein ACWD5R_29965 [Streptomyces sp. NPDC002514]|uniref:hypothetical protein n=1 Tax=Streptomyces sp. NPDC001270 TaxID=3364554 RepID=UPI0036B81F36